VKKSLIIFLMLILSLSVIGCDGPSVNDQQSDLTALNQEKAQLMLGDVPSIEKFTELGYAYDIATLLDDPKLITYAYIRNKDGLLGYVGRGFGFGLPYATQITNPQALTRTAGGYVTLPQADPSLLYKPSEADGTWYMLINESTAEPNVIFIESSLEVYQEKLPLYLLDLRTVPTGYVEGFVNPRETEIQSMMSKGGTNETTKE